MAPAAWPRSSPSAAGSRVQAFLTFALAAPLGAMGAVAVGERREGWARPARSAVLGLVAGCLGVRRDDEEAHASLEREVGLALLVEAAGRPLQDYHTAQMPPRRFGGQPTRRAELAAPDLNTVLTRREYRQDVLCLGALWTRAEGCWAVGAIEEAMRRPRFTLYLGRKSCPLGLPLAPRVISAADPAAALANRRRTGPERKLRAICGERFLPKADSAVVTLDASDAAAFGWHGRREWRRDAVASRKRWQFSLREEAIVPLTTAGASL